MVTGHRPNVSNMRVFGCRAEVFVEKQLRSKTFDETGDNSRSALFIGYCKQSRGYLFYVPELKRVVTRRDASFDEAILPCVVGESTLVTNPDPKLPTVSATTLDTIDDNDSYTKSATEPIKNKDTSSAQSTHKSKSSNSGGTKDTKNSGGVDTSTVNIDGHTDLNNTIIIATQKKSTKDYINERVANATNLSISDALKMMFFDPNKNKQRTYSMADIKYDLKTKLITLKSKSEKSDTVVDTTTTTTFHINPNVFDDLNFDPESNITGVTPPTVERSSQWTRSNRDRQSGRLTRVPTELINQCKEEFINQCTEVSKMLDTENYFRYVEHNQFDSKIEHALYSLGFGDEPLTLEEAKLRPDWKEWWKAMKVEVDALINKGTFKYVPISQVPKGKKIIKCRWVYKRKPDRYKGRLVVKGFMQSPFDYGETYAPVCKLTSIRSMLSHAAYNNYECRQLDIGNAFVEAYLPPGEEVYMENIPGFERPGYVIKLVRALYGLKQAPKHWADLLSKTLLDLGYVKTDYDSCLYQWRDPKTGREIKIACYVDDLLITGDKNYIDEFVKYMESRFTVRDLGEPKTFLGMEITRNRSKRTIKLSQSTYIKNIVEKFGLTNANPVYVPMDPGYKPTAYDVKEDKNKRENSPDYAKFVTLYRSIIGSCMYAQMLCRPDISYAVSVLSRYLNKPTTTHMKHAKRLLTFLYTTNDIGIVYGASPREKFLNFIGSSDSDYAGDLDSRKSQTGWIFFLNGGAVSWRSVLQSCVALSTPEAEYMALSDAGKEARSLLKFAKQLINSKITCITIYEDNVSAEIWTKQNSHASKTKQIDISFHHIRDEVAKNRIKVLRVPSTDNSADLFTKPLNKHLFYKFLKHIFGELPPHYY